MPVVSAVAAAVAAALAGCHPTGSAVPDLVYPALLAALFTLAAPLAPRAVMLVVAAAVVAPSRGWLLIPAGAALLGAFGAVIPRRSPPWAAALIGAVDIEVVLRWPSIGFQGLTALLAAAVVLAVLVSALITLPARHRRPALWAGAGVVAGALVLGVPALVAIGLARPSVEGGATAARTAISDLQAVRSGAAQSDLRRAETAFAAAHRLAGAWWTAGADLVPVLAQQHRAVADLTGAGQRLSVTGVRDAGAIDFHDLKGTAGGINLAAVEALQRPVDEMAAATTDTLAVAQHVRSGWLLPQIAAPLDRFSTELAKESRTLSLADQAVHQVPGLLGADGPRRYLVAFMTPAETRGLGGFLGAYAELSVAGGRISVVRSGLPNALVNPGHPPHLTGPADYLARYGAFKPQLHLEDVTYSPDFQADARVLADLYPQVGGDHVDGVLILDPYSLAALLRFTGPIQVSGFPVALDASNAADILIRQQYIFTPPGDESARHQLLQTALTVGFKRLMSIPLPSPRVLADTLGPEVRQGRLLFWTTAPSYHPFLNRLGVDGDFPPVPAHGSLLAVTLANAGNNKLDAYLSENTADHLTYDPSTGAVQEQVSLTLHNSGSATLPQYVAGSYSGSGLPPGTDLTWLSVYSPGRLTGASLDGRPLGFEPGVPELGVTAHSTFVRIPPLATVHIDLQFTRRLPPGTSLSTALWLQPLTTAPTTTVTVTGTAGWTVSPSTPATWTAGPTQVQEHSWHFRRSTKSR
ncbi:MAG TPA: DUF4012 domain-containing protein [Acidimicrobiales bacterium]|nr:DUF4012 domain-containing protein [Acidimicrobiales bacterium]